MSLVNKTIPGFYNGVSQQPPELRLDTQAEEQINAYGTIVGGLRKRPPTTRISTLASTPSNAYVHMYDRGSSNPKERYIITVKSGKLRVFDAFTGTEKTVNNSTSSYLNLTAGLDPRESFTLLTVADTTFVVNKTKVTAMSGAVDGSVNEHLTKGIYWLKRSYDNGQNGGYTYSLNGASANSTSSSTAAASLATALGTPYGATGSVVYNLSNPPSWTWSDSWGNEASKGFKGKAQKIQDLPSSLGGLNESHRIIVRITGDESNSFQSYWVMWDGASWAETVEPGLTNTIDGSTMPHKLVRNSDGSFTLSQITWGKRRFGDEDTASEPSFIGSTINDIFFFKNRLGLLSGENVILSEVGEFYNFFPTTVTDVLDSDPIDVAVDSNRVSQLSHAVPFNDSVLLFSNSAQFSMNGSETFTPKTASITLTTTFQCNTSATPCSVGSMVYFATPSGNYTGIREYFVEANSTTNDAADVTAHIPTYIPKDVIKIAGSTTQDFVCVLSKETPDTIYVYKYYWQGDQKPQSAWSKWTFSGAVSNIEIIDSTLYIFITRDDGLYAIETLDIATQPWENKIHLDNGTIPYKMSYSISEWAIPAANKNVANQEGYLSIRTFRLTASKGSKYDLTVSINDGERVREMTGLDVEDNLVLVQGVNKKTIITITNNYPQGCQLNTGSFVGNYTIRSRGV